VLWVAGLVAGLGMVCFLWIRGYHAQTAAQASFFNERLGFTSALLAVWVIFGDRLTKRLK
jgi:drug/metabolite transporter (DMT)-like permease